jgi:hypothetical protein
MAPTPDRLHAIGHSRIIAVGPVSDLGLRTILLADRDGTVSMWVPFGVRLSDPLPPDPAHYDVVAVAASVGLVVTAGARAAICGSGGLCRAKFSWCRWRSPPSG